MTKDITPMTSSIRGFYFMATLFKRIRHLHNLGKIRLPDNNERRDFGCIVYREIKKQFDGYVHRGCESIEPEGVFNVRSYPKEVIPILDKMILEKFSKKKRKRISIKKGLELT